MRRVKKPENVRHLHELTAEPNQESEDWEVDLLAKKDGGPKAVLGNIMTILRYDDRTRGRLAYDCRSQIPLWIEQPPWERVHQEIPRAIAAQDAALCAEWITKTYKAGIGENMAHVALVAVARECPFDSFLDFLETLRWDGEHRLDRWLVDLVGVKDSDYCRAVGSKFLISAVARTFSPGCKVDTMLILVGAQGAGKSTVLNVLAGDKLFCDQLDDLNNKDSRLQLQGPVIVEFSELDAMTKKESTTVKAFLSAREDRFRPPYGRAVETFPRRCVFAGTTNLDTFLKDETGGRRFWPVQVSKVDVVRAREIRDQLWAEAVARHREGESWWLDNETEALAKLEQESRRHTDPWETVIRDYLHKSEDEVASLCDLSGHLDSFQIRKRFQKEPPQRIYCTTEELLKYAVEVPIPHQAKREQMRCGDCLRSLGWTKRRCRQNGRQENRYYPPEGFYENTDIIDQERFEGPIGNDDMWEGY